MKHLFYLITSIFALGACAPSHFVKPLAYKQHAVSASLGGAMLKVPGVATIPVPNTTLGYGYGVKQDLTVYGNLYPTAAIFGVFQFDAGCTLQFWKQKNMGATVSPGINFLFDRFEKNAGLWPQLDANFYWNYFERKTSSDHKDGVSQLKSLHVDGHTNFFYVGFSNWFQLKGTMTLGLKQENRLGFVALAANIPDARARENPRLCPPFGPLMDSVWTWQWRCRHQTTHSGLASGRQWQLAPRREFHAAVNHPRCLDTPTCLPQIDR